ncbi:unnamed protein product, partial [Closterium sp. NIES-53]
SYHPPPSPPPTHPPNTSPQPPLSPPLPLQLETDSSILNNPTSPSPNLPTPPLPPPSAGDGQQHSSQQGALSPAEEPRARRGGQ